MFKIRDVYGTTMVKNICSQGLLRYTGYSRELVLSARLYSHKTNKGHNAPVGHGVHGAHNSHGHARNDHKSPVRNVHSYTASRILNHAPGLMYNVVSQVESYSEFLPYCIQSIVTERDAVSNYPVRASLKVGWRQFDESFESKLDCDGSSVIAEALDNSQFQTLFCKWTIRPITGQTAKCGVHFELRFKFNNALYNAVYKSFAPTLANAMIKAFTSRASSLEKAMANSELGESQSTNESI